MHRAKGSITENEEGGLDDAVGANGVRAMYVSEIEKYDKSLVESWKHDMEGLLIFAALFSAISTAFLIESYKSFNTESGDAAIRLLSQISQQLAASPNGGTFELPSFPSIAVPQSSVVCKALWFTSLGLSLSCALVATFVQQRTRQFLRKADRRSGPIVQTRIFSYLYHGAGQFQIDTVVEIAPLLLYASLLFFFGGLMVFLIPVDHAMDIIATLLAIVAVVYCIIAFLDLPYRTPPSAILWRAVQYVQTWAMRRSDHNTLEAANTSVAESPKPHDETILEVMSHAAMESADERSELGHDGMPISPSSRSVSGDPEEQWVRELRSGQENQTRTFMEGEERREQEARDTESSISPPPRPPTVHSNPEDGPSISGVRASKASGSLRAASIVDTVDAEREQFAREREELVTERDRLEAERDAAGNALIAEKQRMRSPEDAETREREHQAHTDRNGSLTKAQLRDITYFIQAQRDAFEHMKALMEERWSEKPERRENKEFKWVELKDMVQKIHDDMESDRARAEGARLADQGKPGIEKVIEDLARQNAEQRELLNALHDTWRADSTRAHEETIAAVQSTAHEQVNFNVQGYLDEFSKALASEVRMLLGEVGKLREERRALQHELGYLLSIQSKYGAGGEFEPDWKPAPGAPGGPPLYPVPPPPLPEPEFAKPAWRTVINRRPAEQRKTNRRDAAPPPAGAPEAASDPRRQVGSWASWQPDPGLAPTPPSREPILQVSEDSSPGLFGPRSPRLSSSGWSPRRPVQSWPNWQSWGDWQQFAPPSLSRKDGIPSWATWQPDPELAPSPPLPGDPLLRAQSWATWQPDPDFPSSPLLPEDPRPQVQSWGTWQNDLSLTPTPPLREDPSPQVQPLGTWQADQLADSNPASTSPPHEDPRPLAPWPVTSILSEPLAADPNVVATPPSREHMMLETPSLGLYEPRSSSSSLYGSDQ
ncbi:hypothetical protein B0H12DRAFT_1126792 [Mycena haematopus]|nr:hypothetical protein B0H12DRAFT_1126792 [Mycena haematopus]